MPLLVVAAIVVLGSGYYVVSNTGALASATPTPTPLPVNPSALTKAPTAAASSDAPGTSLPIKSSGLTKDRNSDDQYDVAGRWIDQAVRLQGAATVGGRITFTDCRGVSYTSGEGEESGGVSNVRVVFSKPCIQVADNFPVDWIGLKLQLVQGAWKVQEVNLISVGPSYRLK